MEFRQRHTLECVSGFLHPFIPGTAVGHHRVDCRLRLRKERCTRRIEFGLRNLVGPDVAPAIQILLKSPRKPLSGFIAVLFGTVTLLFGASSVLTELRDALNTIWRVPVHRSSTQLATVWRLGKERVYSFLMILGLGVLLLVSLGLTPGSER